MEFIKYQEESQEEWRKLTEQLDTLCQEKIPNVQNDEEIQLKQKCTDLVAKIDKIHQNLKTIKMYQLLTGHKLVTTDEGVIAIPQNNKEN